MYCSTGASLYLLPRLRAVCWGAEGALCDASASMSWNMCDRRAGLLEERGELYRRTWSSQPFILAISRKDHQEGNQNLETLVRRSHQSTKVSRLAPLGDDAGRSKPYPPEIKVIVQCHPLYNVPTAVPSILDPVAVQGRAKFKYLL